jgi:V8-like Glu-specific endopeptidase
MTVLLATLLLFSRVVFGSEPSLYGPDTRKDIYQVWDPKIVQLADSSVALFSFWNLGSDNGGRTSVSSTSLRKSQGLCHGQAFANQPTSPYCSGSLVAPDIVLTAGHCVKNRLACLGIKIAFGYSVRSRGAMPNDLDSSDIYGCKEVIHSQKGEHKADFALIRLDRPVTDHAPLALDRRRVPRKGDPVFMMGYPSGLPLKVADGARIRTVEHLDFLANLDSFVGNSGSPVFNATTGLVEGILVDGDTDYEKRPGASCMQVKKCPVDGCKGETITLIGQIIPFLDKAGDL